MDRYRPYYGRSRSGHHRRSSSGGASSDSTTRRRSTKLAICAGIFLVAVLFKLIFPDTLAAVGEKLTAAIDYKSALTVLGQGLSGEKKFTTALGEAFAYAFSGGLPEEQTGEADDAQETVKVNEPSGVAVGGIAAGDMPSKQGSNGDSVQTGSFDEQNSGEEIDDNADTGTEAAEADETESFSDAVIAAFLESQEEYSDYSIPAGVTYDMPLIAMDYTTPIQGVVSSPFGYRMHPIDREVKFHYGIDIDAPEGTAINAFADGMVTAVGESTTLGNYVIIKHGDVETEYGHCSEISVKDGQKVKKGEKIAVIGSTGNATSTCLHFEMRVKDVCVNPGYYLTWE